MARRVSKGSCSPGLDEARDLYSKHFSAGHNTLPISLAVRAPDTLTPVIAYLRLTNGASTNKSSFLLESVLPGSTQGRYSFVGCDPKDIIHAEAGSQDPLVSLEKTLSSYSLIPTSPSSTHLSPPFKGGAVGYVGYDCIYAFERVLKAHRPKKNDLNIPDAYFIISDAIVVFDHLFGSVSIWSHLRIESLDQLDAEYAATTARMQDVARRLATNELQLPKQPPIAESAPREAVSNVGKPGYTGFVRKLRDEHILNGDIIQAVPSQRLSRKTELHPFNAYRHLRQVNPSPYMFYIDCVVPSSSGTSQGGPTSSLQLVGASPECLLSINPDRFVTNHAIAGTIKRGVTPAQDAEMAEILLSSIKDRAEHVMLVDLARNDINRVCKPRTVHVKELMQVQRFSHVMHLTSTVEGQLRDGQTRYDAFRSIFPAGTVSGAPKIKAMELIASLEPSTRGVYAGAVGRWNFGTNADTQECDTCIAIRTMLFKDGTVYLQAGGGIVWDSEEEAEYQETVDKLGANVRTLQQAEELYAEESDEMHNVDAEST